MKIVPTIAYYYNSITEVMAKRKERTLTKEDGSKRTASNRDEDSSSGEEEGELPPQVPKWQRRLIEEDKNKKSSPPPSSPDHTYKTSDDEENTDQEREWDLELENMDPCTSTEELESSAESHDNYDDDGDDESFLRKEFEENAEDYVVVSGRRGIEIRQEVHRIWRDWFKLEGMSAKESSMSKKLPGRTLQTGSQLTSGNICFELSSLSAMNTCLVRLSRK